MWTYSNVTVDLLSLTQLQCKTSIDIYNININQQKVLKVISSNLSFAIENQDPQGRYFVEIHNITVSTAIQIESNSNHKNSEDGLTWYIVGAVFIVLVIVVNCCNLIHNGHLCNSIHQSRGSVPHVVLVNSTSNDDDNGDNIEVHTISSQIQRQVQM